MNRFDAYESVYWVFTQRCNDACDHCYNLSSPNGARMTDDDCLAIIQHLPTFLDRLILSGGEPLADRKQLYLILDAVKARYSSATNPPQIMLQTNGDLLTPTILDTLLDKGVTRIDLASIDRYHRHQGARLETLIALFRSRGMHDENTDPLIGTDNYTDSNRLSFGYWGSTDDMWLGGNWARGRAMETGIWKHDGLHNFCSIVSGARGFLGGTELIQELCIQLWRVTPCCVGTYYEMGDARTEPLSSILERAAAHPVFQALNEGAPFKMGTHIGITEEHARERSVALENICLWCDEFFERHSDLQPTSGFIPLRVLG